MTESIDPSIESVIQKLLLLPPSPRCGRTLSFVDEGENQAEGALDNPDHMLNILLKDMRRVVSASLLVEMPVVEVEQFCLQTVLTGESGAELLARLVTAFTAAYSQQDTQDAALSLLQQLEDLTK